MSEIIDGQFMEIKVLAKTTENKSCAVVCLKIAVKYQELGNTNASDVARACAEAISARIPDLENGGN